MVGVVIVTYNSKKYINKCLRSLSKQIDNFVVLVDNGSRDGVVKKVRKQFPKVEIIENEANLGFSKAANRGIRTCLGKGCEYVMLLNPDTKMEDGALKEMVKVMKGGKGGKKEKTKFVLQRRTSQRLEIRKIAITQPLITLMSDPKRVNTSGNRYRGFGLVTLGGYGREIGKDYSAGGAPAAVGGENSRIEYASGACMLVRSEIFKWVGLLDERFFMYYEDTEFSMRVRNFGYEIVLASKARVQHDYRLDISPKKLGRFVVSWFKYYTSS